MPNRKFELAATPLYQYGRDIQKARERSPLLEPEEEKDLIIKAQAGDIAARDRIIEAHLRSVMSVANAYRGRGVEYLDLIQEGNLGLMKALDRFKISFGTRFNTYALWWIRHAIQRCIQHHAKTIRIPVHHQILKAKIDKITMNFLTSYGRKPTDEEIAEKLGISLERLYRFYVREIHYRISLTRQTDEYDSPYLDELDLEDRNQDPVDTEAQIHELVEIIEDALGHLKKMCKASRNTKAMRDMKIFMKRLFDEDATLTSIGREHNLSRERVRQICKVNAGIVRHALEQEGI